MAVDGHSKRKKYEPAWDGAINVIDMKTWQRVRSIATPGPGFFLRSHEATPYAWAVVAKDVDAELCLSATTHTDESGVPPQATTELVAHGLEVVFGIGPYQFRC